METKITAVFTPSRKAGLDRLAGFLPRAGRAYAARRNTDEGPDGRSAVSVLSPWIRHRLISESEVVRAVLGVHRLSDAAKFIQEVCWRTYWKGWLETRPRVWADYKDQRDADLAALDTDGALRARYDAATGGATGLASADAWARELVETGYLHNHARMWFASVWLYTLELPWTLGADFFLRHLADGDPAANTLSWRWVGGLHTPGKTYLARPDNIARYTEGRFAPDPGALARAAPPIDGPPNPIAGPLPQSDPPPSDPFALLITEDDAHPLTLGDWVESARAIGWSAEPEARSPLETGAPARTFSTSALAHGAALVADAVGVEPRALAALSAEALVDFAAQAQVSVIAVAEPPVGPVRDALDAATPGAEAAGVRLVRVRRDWDAALWPHAGRGFFGLKAKIPSALAGLGMPVDAAADAAFGAKTKRRPRER